VEPGNQSLITQVKAGAFVDVLTLGLGKGEVGSFHWPWIRGLS
jgi:hypothetical protein